MGRGLLILTAGFIIIVGIIQLSINNRQQIIPQRSAEYFEESETHNIANSIMDYAVAEVTNDQYWDQGYSPSSFLGAEAKVDVFNYQDYLDNDSDIPSDHDIKNWNKYTILLVSQVRNKDFGSSTQVILTRDSFSKYTYFTDYEASNIYFYSDDVLEGPVHTNGTLKIAGSPTFKGDVTSPNQYEEHSNYTNNPDFQADTNFSSQRIELPLGEGIENLRTLSKNGGLHFDEDIFVEFKTKINGGDTLGTVDVSSITGYTSSGDPVYSDPINYDLSSINGVISSEKKVFTKGKIKGKVTLHSQERVEIMGDLEYNTDPTQFESSSDLLGIVSEGDVILDKNAYKDQGTKDVTIQASILAIDESFKVEDYADGDPRGTINLLGGLQQKRRGAVGTFGYGGIASGYSKSYSYDRRLLRLVPPAYPRESFFTKVSWKEKPVTKIN